MKKPTFKTAYLSFVALLALVVIILLLSVYSILSKFEKSQAKYMVEDYVASMQDAISEADVTALSALSPDTDVPLFATKEALFSQLISACAGSELSYELSPKSFDVNNPIYNVICDNKIVTRIQLALVSEKVKLGFLSIPEWKLTSLMPAADTLGSSYTFSIPSSFSVKANEILLTSENTIANENGISTYYVEGFTDTAVFEIKDAYGNAVTADTPVLLDASQSDRLYTVPVSYERFDFTVPADFSVALTKGDLCILPSEHYNVYSIYSAVPITADFLSDYLEATDSIGNRLVFDKSGDVFLPVYDEYTITAPDCYRVFVGKTLLDPASASRSDLTTPQYQSEPIQLATYQIGLSQTSDFCVLDEQDTPIAFEQSDNTVTVPLLDCTVTIPENFTLQINGQAPECSPILKDNTDYQYITEYTEVPLLAEYKFSSLAKAPTFTVTDNLGTATHYLLTKGGELNLTSQTGIAELPDSLAAALDPLSIAKKWSLFMTNDLEGSLNGYYNMRDFLVRGSYYDTVAYQWATNIDITFISDHTFRNPAFSKESVSNVVVYKDTCFSCDIYFEKHMILTRTGKLQDDIFHRRMFFVYVDDTDDNRDNPHWVIADMQEIQ